MARVTAPELKPERNRRPPLAKALFSSKDLSEIASVLTMEHFPIHLVAALLNVDRWTLAKWRLEQKGPPFVRLKRGVIVYPREAFARYLQNNQRKDLEATGCVPPERFLQERKKVAKCEAVSC